MSALVKPELDATLAAPTRPARWKAGETLGARARAVALDDRALGAYLHGPDSSADKTATLGALLALLARTEFLVGWLAEGGVHKRPVGWEHTPERWGKNQGPFPTLYQTEVLTSGYEKGAEWCTSFVGFLAKRLGFRFATSVNPRVARSIFHAGYRLHLWATTGLANNATLKAPADVLTPAEDILAHDPDSVLLDPNDWKALHQALKPPAKRAQAWAAFAAAHPNPQPGDILVLGRNNKFKPKAKSHTVLVESFDPATATLTTIEGNANNAVRARSLRLNHPADVRDIVCLVRLGQGFFEPPSAVSVAPVHAEDLLRPLRDLNASLLAAAPTGWFKSSDPEATAADLHGPLPGDATA